MTDTPYTINPEKPIFDHSSLRRFEPPPVRRLRRAHPHLRLSTVQTLCLRGTQAQIVSIHAPRTGGDVQYICAFSHMFQSTPPARGATYQLGGDHGLVSIHAPRTGGDSGLMTVFGYDSSVSIHAPRTGGDASVNSMTWINEFQSTPPARGATVRRRGNRLPHSVSIHAPRTGGDTRLLCERAAISFNPRPPHGGRPATGSASAVYDVSIHAPRTGGDSHALDQCQTNCVSIHAPRTGGDGTARSDRRQCRCFNPRPPHGGRP